MECEATPSRINNDDLLQQYLVEENSDLSNLSPDRPYSIEEEGKQMVMDVMIEEKTHVEKSSDDKRSQIIEEKKEIIPELTINPEKVNDPLGQISDFICNCKKSKCLKLYCECFAKGKLCNSLCNCLDCYNKQEDCKQRKLALRNIYLKARKNEKDVDDLLDMDLDSFVKPNTNSKNVGCNCKKSHCKKKYCECYDEGRPCGDHCKCEGCRNYLGAKVKRKEKNHNNPITSTSKINTRNKNQKNNSRNAENQAKDDFKCSENKNVFKVVNVDRKGIEGKCENV